MSRPRSPRTTHRTLHDTLHRTSPPGRPLVAAPLVAALLVAALLAGCGDATPPGRYAVVTRAFSWSADEPAVARVPLSRVWEFAGSQPDWRAAAGEPRKTGDGLHLFGAGRVGIEGPDGVDLDAEVLDWITIDAVAQGATHVELRWRGGAPYRQALSPDEPALSVHVTALRSVNHDPDAPILSIAWVAEGGRPVDVQVRSVGVVSDDDHEAGGPLAERRLQRDFVLRRGVSTRAPGTLRTRVEARAGDRLRLALATSGARYPVTITLSDAAGLLSPQRLTCAPGGPWVEHAVDLPAPPPGGTWELALRLEAPDDATAVVLVGSAMLLRRAETARPDVVLYVEDTLRADRLGVYGYARPTDPHLVSVAAAGTAFERVWSTTNWTRPALSSLLTGLDPVAHGNRRSAHRVPDALTTLAEALAAEGWVTASFVTNHHGGSWSGLDQGFDAHGDPDAFGAPALESTLTSALIEGPIEAFLREHADERVFVFAHSLDPHAPLVADEASLAALDASGVPPEKVPDDDPDVQRLRYAARHYDGEVRHNDTRLAELDAALAARATPAGTLFVFVSDHGEAFRDHGQWEHRRTLHEEEVRVPWVLRWPGVVAAGRRPDLPVSLVDVAPTVLGLLDAPAPPDLHGRDLSALCRGGSLPPPVPLFLDALIRADDGTLVHDAAVVLWPHKLLLRVDAEGSPQPLALYRLDEDPDEREDLLGAEADAALVSALTGVARERLEAGPRAPEGEGQAAAMSPALEDWLRQMGYLR